MSGFEELPSLRRTPLLQGLDELLSLELLAEHGGRLRALASGSGSRARPRSATCRLPAEQLELRAAWHR